MEWTRSIRDFLFTFNLLPDGRASIHFRSTERDPGSIFFPSASVLHSPMFIYLVQLSVLNSFNRNRIQIPHLNRERNETR